MLQTRFTKLVGCSVPLQQAGMGGLARQELAAAVSRAGALGMLGGVMQPADALAPEVENATREADAPVGVNFLMPFLDREAVDAAAGHARVLEFFYDEPDPSLVEAAHSGGALAAWQVGSAEEARAAEPRPGATSWSLRASRPAAMSVGTTGLLPLLDEVLEAIDVPVVAAGGIGTGRAMAAVLAAGADAARVGTRFVAAAEADMHPDYAQALIESGPADTILTEAFSVMWPMLRIVCCEAASRQRRHSKARSWPRTSTAARVSLCHDSLLPRPGAERAARLARWRCTQASRSARSTRRAGGGDRPGAHRRRRASPEGADWAA